eukprot:7410497-Karenia_brevis.AAC.1
MPEQSCNQYPVIETAASASGLCYLGADGSEIPNQGGRRIYAMAEDGTTSKLRFQVCPVTKAIGQ